MDGLIVPYIPASLWILTGATTILILLVAFGCYIFWQKWATKIAGDGASVASLNATKTILEKDIEALRIWIDGQKGELDRLTAEREEQERLRAILADLEQQCAVKNQENQGLRNEVGELENQRHNIAQTLERMQREIGDLSAKKAEAQAIESRLADLRSRFDEAQQAIRNSAELEIKLSILSNEKISLERAVEEIRDAAESRRIEYERLSRETDQARAEFERIDPELTRARKEKAESEVIIDTLRHEQNALEKDIERKEQRIDILSATVQATVEEIRRQTAAAKEARNELERLSGEQAQLKTGIYNMQRDRSQLEITVSALRDERQSLERGIERLKEELGELSGTRGKEEGEEAQLLHRYTDLLKGTPDCLDRSAISKMKLMELDESQALLDLHNSLEAQDLKFSERILRAFHTSLKCSSINPITVLAGVSGTGKTLLPVKYAQIMGMHSLLIPVQPRWDSPQDLFGFYNYLEKQYKATDLSKALIRMNPYKSDFAILDGSEARGDMLLVLLDEMNLARTEYYFSEFLSKLEIRSLIEDPDNVLD